MGGFVKVTIRNLYETTTRVVDTNELNNYLSSMDNMINGDVKNHILNNSVEKQMFPEDAEEQELLFPFNYGYIFIDRIEKKIWYCNDYTPISYYSSYSFNELDYINLKKQNFKVKIEKKYNPETNEFDEVDSFDVRKESITFSNLNYYYKLYNSINFISKVKYKEKEITAKDNFIKILDEIMELKRCDKPNNSTYEIQVCWKDWLVEEKNISTLFEYLDNKDLLSKYEKEKWKEYLKDQS